MKRKTLRAIASRSFALVVLLGAAWHAIAQDGNAAYPSMAPVDQYLMADRSSEIALAQSAAPWSDRRGFNPREAFGLNTSRLALKLTGTYPETHNSSRATPP